MIDCVENLRLNTNTMPLIGLNKLLLRYDVVTVFVLLTSIFGETNESIELQLKLDNYIVTGPS